MANHSPHHEAAFQEVEHLLRLEQASLVAAAPTGLSDRVFLASVGHLPGRLPVVAGQSRRIIAAPHRRIGGFARAAMAAGMAIAFGVGALVLSGTRDTHDMRLARLSTDLAIVLQAMPISDGSFEESLSSTEQLFDAADLTYDAIEQELDALETAIFARREGS